MLYFDHNATHPLSCVARDAWLEATERFAANPSSPHRLGARADAALANARESLAEWLECDPAQIVWTSGATEANNAVLHHFSQRGVGVAWISAVEHPCVMASAATYLPERHEFLPVTAAGVVDLEQLRERIRRERPGLVAVMAANNETGVLQPWREVRDLCRGAEVEFFCDAAQWVGKLPADGLGGCDFMSGCAHKFGGPQGVGFLKVPPRFQPLIVGGPQEEGRRAGTENVAGILSMIAALGDRRAAMTPGFFAEQLAMRARFEDGLRQALPGTAIVGASAERLWNTVAAVMPEVPDCRQRWVVKLDKLGFAVSTGSACASGKEQSSHVLAAMGVSGPDAGRVLRFSSGWKTTQAEWDALLAGIAQAHRELQG